MKTGFATNLYDKDGDSYEDGVLLFIKDHDIILRFENAVELRDFAKDILDKVMPEIIETSFDELCESDQKELGPGM